MATIYMYVGDTAPSVTDTLKEAKSDGSIGPMNLSALVSLKFRLRSQFGSTLLIDDAGVVVNAPAGAIRYDWTLANTTLDIDSSAGPYKAYWFLDFGGGTTLTTPEFDVLFQTHAPRRTVGPCTDWCSSNDVTACFSDVTPGTCLTSAVQMASELLYELSGEQFGGWCQSIIRPCQDGGPCLSCMQVLERGHIIWNDNGWCGFGDNNEPCGCGGWLQKIRLPGIAQYVVQVKIDGAPLLASAYRLDPDGTLFRVDGGAWPTCQNMAAPDTAAGTFAVTYGFGYEPPELGRRAAAQMAREFWLACNGAACALPAGVVEIARQGITIKRAVNLFKDGATGLKMVDAFTTAYPGDTGALVVMSPDTMPTERRTG